MVQPSKWTVCKCGDVWITESDSKSQKASQRISLGVALYDSLAARNASLAILPCSFFNYILRFGVLGFWGNNVTDDLVTSMRVVVDEIFSTYDIDDNGIMSKDEAKNFVKEYIPQFSSDFVYSN